MTENSSERKPVEKGFPMGGSALFDNFAAIFGPAFDVAFEKADRKYSKAAEYGDQNDEDKYIQTNSWRGHYIVPEGLRLPEKPLFKKPGMEKPEYPEGDLMLKNAEDLGELAKVLGRKYNIPEVKEAYPFYKKGIDKLYESWPEENKKMLKKYENPFIKNYMKRPS